jgi:rhodanese-related sulfurtransferase
MFARKRLPFERLSPDEVQRRTGQPSDPAPFLLDVREVNELRFDGTIDGATHIPMNELPARIDELPADAEIIVYCAHGSRSVAVAEWLTRQGFTDVKDLNGGLHAWKQRGLPVVRG